MLRQLSFFSFLCLLAASLQQVCSTRSVDATCEGLSADVQCSMCDQNGRCTPGSVGDVDPWLKFALKTQMDIQIDIPFDQIQFIGTHNSYNARAYGDLYGGGDTCIWPPPYEARCMGLANQEFSLLDQLKIGARHIELDNVYCENEMRLVHAGTDFATTCTTNHITYLAAIQEIATFLNDPENSDEIFHINLSESFDQGNDDEINGPIEQYFGSRVLTPDDVTNTYGGSWPTMRQMRQNGKNVVIASDFTHGDVYIHLKYWDSEHAKKFTPYPDCGGMVEGTVPRPRFYADSTHYPFVYDGPTRVGVIDDLSDLVRCPIPYVAVDQITPSLLETGVYTWATGEPSQTPDKGTCVYLSGADHRWYTSSDCSELRHHACVNTNDHSDWSVSGVALPYSTSPHPCPAGYKFGVPPTGHSQQKLVDVSGTVSVWINYSSLL